MTNQINSVISAFVLLMVAGSIISINSLQFGNSVSPFSPELNQQDNNESCVTTSPSNTTLHGRLPGGGCHPNTGLVDLENKNTMIGGKNISSLIDSINDHLNNTRKLLSKENISVINNTLGLAEQDLSLLGEKLNHIGASIYKCIVSDCGRPPF